LKKIIIALCLISVTQISSAAGCMKGAALGGTAGHFAGHHAVIGAGIGCLLGRHSEKKKAEQEKLAQSYKK
jgi:hypothetical protein